MKTVSLSLSNVRLLVSVLAAYTKRNDHHNVCAAELGICDVTGAGGVVQYADVQCEWAERSRGWSYEATMMHRMVFFFVAAFLFLDLAMVGLAAPPIEIDRSVSFHVELPAASPTGEASIREHSIAWHPGRQKYYLVADVVPLDSPHHPNTYDTELHLWSSGDLAQWTYHGVAVAKGEAGTSYDGFGVASPAGMAFFRGRLYVPFSARRTSRFDKRSIGLAVSGTDPEKLRWAKTNRPVSDLPGEDDDPALLVMLGDDSLHLYHRRTGPGGYRIVHTASKTPTDSDTWPAAQPITPRPQEVRAQELTGVFAANGKVHVLVIEHLVVGGMQIAHLASETPDGPFSPTDPNQRYLPPDAQPRQVAYGGHITPILKEETPVAFFWTVPQKGKRYGLRGHPVRSSGIRRSSLPNTEPHVR